MERVEVALSRCARLIELAGPMGWTFYRAFDMVADPFGALDQLITLGFERILTSGQALTALDGAQLIESCVRRAQQRIVIMPGSGITTANISLIRALTGAIEFHTSAKRTDPLTGAYVGVDVLEVAGMRRLLSDER